jgi:2-methylfumaryl-CoA isomerase
MGSNILDGLRLVELSAYVAAPLAGMSLAQLGAEVIRVDQEGGGPDLHRWPVTKGGVSHYWTGLNKAKRSVFVDLRREAGQRRVQDLICETGVVLTNMPPRAWLDYETLRRRRPDLIMLVIRGTHDHRTAVDYTIQARTGLPFLNGDGRADGPINQALPAWDTTCGMTAATGLLAAERRRRATGEGAFIELALEDVALWTLGNLGYLSEAELGESERTSHGNDVYGAFGRDFATACGRRVMVVALTSRQWRALLAATELDDAFAHLERALGADLDDDAERWRWRRAIAAILEPWFEARDLDEVRRRFDPHRVLWGPYQSVGDLVRDDPACSEANPLFRRVDQPGIGSVLTPGTPLRFADVADRGAAAAPEPGADTAAVLTDLAEPSRR